MKNNHNEQQNVHTKPDSTPVAGADRIACDNQEFHANHQALRERLEGHEQRLQHGDARFAQLEAALAENTSITREIKDILDSARGAFKALNFLGRLAAMVTPLVALGTALYAAFGGKK